LTGGFVMADLWNAHEPRAEHAAYIASWLKVMKNDPRTISTAASKAQAAADLGAREAARRKRSPSVRGDFAVFQVDCQDKSPSSVQHSFAPIST
jgi:antirestriction protein ArdC